MTKKEKDNCRENALNINMLKYLPKINSPLDLKALNYGEVKELAGEIRSYMLSVVSENGGHLAEFRCC